MLDDATRPSTPAALILFAVLLAAAAWWGGLSPALQPPPVQPESAPAADFSAQRARRHLQVIAGQPRPLGSAAHARARDHIVAALRELGLEPHLQHETVLHGAGARLAVVPVANVMARLPGSRRQAGGDPGPAVVLMAHYDSVPHSPGVNDAGNGVAAVLETLRALRAGPVLQNDVIALFTDAEESACSAPAPAGPSWAADAGVVLNAEGRGRGGAVCMFRSVGDNGGMVRTWPGGAAGDGRFLAAALFDLMPNDTDLSVFAAAGIPGLDFANIRGLSHYHTGQPEQADPRGLQHHGDYLPPGVPSPSRTCAPWPNPDASSFPRPGWAWSTTRPAGHGRWRCWSPACCWSWPCAATARAIGAFPSSAWDWRTCSPPCSCCRCWPPWPGR